jgi:hypothetical protein
MFSTATTHVDNSQSACTATVGVTATSWNRFSIAAVVLAMAAVAGRLVSFVVDGPSSLNYLLLLLVIAVSALVCARRVCAASVASSAEKKLVGMARRIATVQTFVGMGFLLVTLT